MTTLSTPILNDTEQQKLIESYVRDIEWFEKTYQGDNVSQSLLIKIAHFKEKILCILNKGYFFWEENSEKVLACIKRLDNLLQQHNQITLKHLNC